jgi:hypothetical protein
MAVSLATVIRVVVPEQVIDQAPVPQPEHAAAGLTHPPTKSAGSRTGVGVLLHPAVLTAAALLLISAILVLIAGTRPGFDPYGWLVWGRQTVFWNLSTNGAPSWKPLPYLFTVPFALFGRAELWLWMVFAAAVDLAGCVFAYRIAYRLIGVSEGRRHPAVIGGLVAAAGVLGISQYPHFIFSSQSDPMIVSLCLAAIDAHLCERPRLALAMLALAGLGRPEAWAFLGLYGLWMWLRVPHGRRAVGVGFFVQPLLWFGIPGLTASSWFVAGNLALHSAHKLHQNKIVGVWQRFESLQPHALEAVAVICVLWAIARRDRVTAVIAAAAALWFVIEVMFALHGWPAVPRYMFEPAGVEAVLAGIAVGWALALPAHVPEAIRKTNQRSLQAAGAVAVLAFGAAMVPAAVSAVRWERKDLKHERARERQIANFSGLVTKLGGPLAIRRCGQPTSLVEYQSIIAWYENMSVGFVGFDPARVTAAGKPAVFFNPHGTGWHIGLIHPNPALKASCERLVTISRTP